MSVYQTEKFLEFFSSDCDERLIFVEGFSINKQTGVIEWQVFYKLAQFTVSDDVIKMEKYLTPEMLVLYNEAMNVPEEEKPKGVYWGDIL